MNKRFFLPDHAIRQELGCLVFTLAPIGILLAAIMVFDLGGFGLATIPAKLAHQISLVDRNISMELSELRARLVWLTAVLILLRHLDRSGDRQYSDDSPQHKPPEFSVFHLDHGSAGK
ncbi:hypothetical protein sS8_4752 [Methylocaldum marinum]|uniref:Uncharacterized protein n=1 Tax=Methylocaldum marinum TaxID=1432792 RepID=A0A250KYH0_9GAMM|nr:hypothetical protein [Methylocaldum marinum]BBA36675.1 hypothetical protein sS8_4752 [Methylocaldum marinum]